MVKWLQCYPCSCLLTNQKWHFIPCQDTCIAEQLADLYASNIFCLHGLPKTVVSNRGTQFIANFWKGLCKILKIEALPSTPYYPETDGQTEQMNAILEQYLRIYINYLQDNWESWLYMAEFAANNQGFRDHRDVAILCDIWLGPIIAV